MDLKKEIIRLANDLNIQKIGFARADNFETMRASLEEQKAKGHTSGFEHKNLDERLNPDLTLKGARTIISVALAYPNKLLEKPEKTNYRRGSFARASWGIDYHTIMQGKLDLLITGIKDLISGLDYKAFVDTGPLIDVAVAARAGLGFIGKNGLLVTREYGSYVYLGEIITDLELAPDSPVDYGCGDCTRCLDFCPTKALLGDGRMNAQRCLSFQTQNKGILLEEYREKMKTVIYGCDICQMVCPYNKGIDSHFHPQMEGNPELVQPELLPFLDLTNKEFKEKFGTLAGSWRGRNVLQRNAIYALANARDKSSIPKLLEIIEKSQNEIFVASAFWSLGKLVKEPNQEMVNLVSKRKLTNEASASEREKLLEIWYS
ncbi:tRNA epoxyqueuosine(34) reductase QueG [Streptococcaceae bacterium ESL0729]|nr:tRNA epoxyqueuosine(34) reductase QueG [Streptococcaceae bacterium ESL0729]